MRILLNVPTWFLLGLIATATIARAAEPDPADLEFFENKVRPLLVQHCQKCHGTTKQEAGLRLDSREAIVKGGDNGPALETEKPSESLLLEAVAWTGDIKMPPKAKLAAEEIAILGEWVRRGAPWPIEKKGNSADKKGEFNLAERKAAQWAFQPIRPQTPPKVSHEPWPQSDVDRFILAKLEASGLKPAPRADKRILLRRATYDLIGLPPSAAEIDAFLADESPQAWERVVDRLLESPHYGERWARHWLDLVRYAETMGHEFDFEIPFAWEYRDYVIRAFNADVPYDQFVIEHLAGDLLPQPRRNPTDGSNESLIGTAFWYLGESKHSPVDVRADEAERIDNQIDVFGKAFLGQTLGCARCHDHKFDALSTKDYYALSGYLQSSRMQIACLDAPEKRLELVARLTKLRDERATLLSDVAPRAPQAHFAAKREEDVVFANFATDDFRDWFITGEAFGAGPISDPRQILVQAERGWPIGATGLAHSGGLAGRLEGVLRSRTFTIEKKFILYLAAGKGSRINLIVDSLQHLRNPIYGGLTIPIDSPERLKWYTQDVSKWIGHNAYIELVDSGDGFLAAERVEFSDNPAAPYEPNHGTELTIPESLAPKLAELAVEQQKLDAEIHYHRRVVAMTDGSAEDDFVHVRGNAHKFGDVVPRRFLEAIAGNNQTPHEAGSGRLELARRVVDASNPLLARVIVNRLWKHHFGEGLVRTPDDLGNMGQPPTHPELLDWLALQLAMPTETPPLSKGGAGGVSREGSGIGSQGSGGASPGRGPWSLKRLHRLLLLTSTYQMSSRPDDAHAEEVDPQNKQWHRMNLRRLEGEIIRDAILSVSGRLDPKMFGPPVPPHLTPFMIGRGRPDKSGPLDGDGRRSIYLGVRRNFLTPMFLAFDAPVPFATIGRRSVSNVPAQALALMNNPLVLQQAEVWAKKTLAENAADDARLRAMYVSAFGREPSVDERTSAKAFLAEQARQSTDGAPSDPARPWAELAHVLLNVKEFIFVE